MKASDTVNPYYLEDAEGGYYNKYPEFQVWEEGRQAGIKEVVERVKAQTIDAKRNASEVYEAHKQLKPRDKQSEAWHDGYDCALQELIDFLQSKLKEWDT